MRLYKRMYNDTLNKLEVDEIIGILSGMDENYKQVIVMRYINQLSPPEIAEIMGISTNAVSVKINYAIKKLRETIKIKRHEI